MDSGLLTKALNYHGQELLRAIEEHHGKDELRCIDLRSVDYHEYHKRAKEFRFKERQKRQKLLRFIGMKCRQLYATQDIPRVIPSARDVNDEELCAVVPPLESFMSVPGAEKRRHFFENLRKLDLVIGQVIGKHDNGMRLNLQLVCMDGGKKRDIFDLGIKVNCHIAYVACGNNFLNPLLEYKHKDYVRAMVTDVTPHMEKIRILLRTELLSKELQLLDVKLGLITEEELPAHHRNYLNHPGKTYEQVLRRILGFANPATVTHMCNLVGLPPNKPMSLMRVLHRVNYPRDDYAVELRKVQSANWAYKSVEDGVAYFKVGNLVEAFQCLNRALEIHPDNVGALVARGALFANTSNLTGALEDFERALVIDPNHVNGKKYVSDTLMAQGRYHEDKGDMVEAAKTYQLAIQSDSSNANAKDALIAKFFAKFH